MGSKCRLTVFGRAAYFMLGAGLGCALPVGYFFVSLTFNPCALGDSGCQNPAFAVRLVTGTFGIGALLAGVAVASFSVHGCATGRRPAQRPFRASLRVLGITLPAYLVMFFSLGVQHQ